MVFFSFIDPAVVPFVGTFLLVFAIVFGLLSYVANKPEDEKKKSNFPAFDKKVNAIISIVFALFAATYEPLVFGLQEFMPLAIVALIAVFFALFLKKLFAGEKSDTFPQVVALGVLLILLGVFRESVSSFLPWGFDTNNVLWIIGVIIVILFFVAAYNYKAQ